MVRLPFPNNLLAWWRSRDFLVRQRAIWPIRPYRSRRWPL